MTAREYKQAFGLDLKKGIMTDADRAHMREMTLAAGMADQLRKVGVNSRFKKGQPGLGTFPRSEQTKKFLGQLHKLVTNHRKERFKKNCLVCGKEFEVVKSKLSQRFCGHKCTWKFKIANRKIK
jgi:hypothetical protein